MGRVVPDGRVCCPNCFEHNWIRDQVRTRSRRRGACDYCRANNVPVLEIESLRDEFRNWFSMYELDQEPLGLGSDSLLEKAQLSWSIFDDELDERTQGGLLEDILNCLWDDDDDDGELPVCAYDLYTFAGGPLHLTEAQAWSEYCASVRENPNEILAFGDHVVEDILNAAEEVANAGATFYRGRLGSKIVDYQEQPYSGGEIGAPPVGKTTDGRGNKKGQRVLYCAEGREYGGRGSEAGARNGSFGLQDDAA